MGSIPDVEEYYAIFDDYLDFKINPWDEHGYDEGVMIPERKVALRYMLLAMNIHQNNPNLLPTDLLSFMSDYAKPEYREPQSMTDKNDNKKTKYSDLRKEVEAAANEQEGKNAVKTSKQQQQQNNTGLSQKELQGFNFAARKGASTSDVIEKTETIFVEHGKMGPRYKDITTRSVFWDVPGEDSIHKESWDVSTYTSPEDMAKINNNKSKIKNKKNNDKPRSRSK